MARKQTTASQRQLLESTLSTLATLITELAPQAQVEITFEQYEDEDAHVYVHPPRDMPAEDVERLDDRGALQRAAAGNRPLYCQCGVQMMAMKSSGHCMGVENGSTSSRTTVTARLFEYFDYTA
jgi:hypothetical protein